MEAGGQEWVDARGRTGATLATAHEAGQVGGVSAVLLRGRDNLVSGSWDMKLKARHGLSPSHHTRLGSALRQLGAQARARQSGHWSRARSHRGRCTGSLRR